MANRLQARVPDHKRWPLRAEDVESVRVQLERMLGDPLFNQSRRYPRLLRRIVEDSLAGRHDNLKERVLGIELFERTPDYDTNADAIVRVTAAEIRKRIAQYYHENSHRQEPRIDLPVGGYIAEFSPPLSQEPTPANSAKPAIEPAAVKDSPPVERPASRRWRRWWLAGPLAAVFLAGAALAIHQWFGPRDIVGEFWQPFTDGRSVPLLCVGQLPVNIVPQGPQDSLARSMLTQRPVSISDTVVISEYATFLGAKGIRPRIEVSTVANYTDLRQHPVLLVGGLDNNWTLRFLEGLRYRMHSRPDSSVLQIYDSGNPSAPAWSMDFAKASAHVTEDYAIVARFYSSSTENTVVIAAGLGENGTAAAADFLLHSQYLRLVSQDEKSGWRQKNIELVLKTEIIDGNSGPPVIVARYFW